MPLCAPCGEEVLRGKIPLTEGVSFVSFVSFVVKRVPLGASLPPVLKGFSQMFK